MASLRPCAWLLATAVDLDEDTATPIAGLELSTFISEDGTRRTEVRKYKLVNRARPLDMLMQHLNGYKAHQQAPLDPGARQGSCRLIHAASGCLSSAFEWAATTESRSGLRVTGPMGVQSRVGPDHRAGLRWRASRYSAWRAARMA